MSNLVAHTDALGRITNFTYDDFNRMVQTTYPDATAGATRLFTTVTYDAGGNVTQKTDTAGRVTSYLYDNLNHVVSTTDADNKTTTLEYDALGRTTALLDARSQRYRFNYDALGRLKHIRRGSTVMSYTYDAVGNVKHRTDYNGALTVYDYDALNRLKTTSYPDATTIALTYDKLSRMQTATNENGTINLDYNKMNHIVRATDVFGQVIECSYDDNGNRTKLNLNSTLLATYKYDAVNRPTKILDAASAAFTFDYDVIDRLTQKKAPKGVKTTYQYDNLDRLTRLLDAKGPATIADRQYQYNAASQITQIAEPANTKSFGYDAVDRLTSALYTNPLQPAENYAYDAVGNRNSSQLSASYNYQPFNRLTNTSTAIYNYDSNGNLISKTDSNGSTQYTWDFENRLKQVSLPNGNTIAYKYDALGRRIRRSPSVGVSTNFVYDGQDVVKDINSDGSTVDYVNGPGIDNKLRLTDSRLAATGPLYFVHDHLGSTTAFTNSLGVAVSQATYDSFGNANVGANLTRYTYTGREFDSDTGLYYYRARWYDPQIGRFISEDPIGLAGGINSFAYVSNNPQNKTDPLGLFDIDVHYYLTYYLARKTGCFKDWESRLIAEGDQRSDEDGDKSPGAGMKLGIGPDGRPDIVPDWRQQQANMDFHAFGTAAQNAKQANKLYREAVRSGDLLKLGTYMHFLQDEFSHFDFQGNPVTGQLSKGNSVDHTSYNPARAMEMAKATWEKLKQYGKNRGCPCTGEMSDADWKTVKDFIDVGYDPATLTGAGGEYLRGVNDDQLRRKVAILGILAGRSRNLR
jgi:RHS repeat-associated protein